MAQLLPSTHPFTDYKVYGPYKGMKGSKVRRMVTLKSPDHMTTMAYARYLMCIQEGRWLNRDEEADHIDQDPLNDDLSNLRVLSHDENVARNATGNTMVTLTCPWCDRSFERRKNNTHLIKGGSPSCCSRSCSGKRSRAQQLSERIPSA